MNFLAQPWLEVAISLALIGSFAVALFRDSAWTFGCHLAFAATSFVCAFLAWLGFRLGTPVGMILEASPQGWLFGRLVFRVDELGAPLVPAIALIHLMTALATARTHMRRFSSSWSLVVESLLLATFTCTEPWVLIALASLKTIPPFIELVVRGRPTRLYVMYASVFVGLMVLGWSAVGLSGGPSGIVPWWAATPLLLAILVRCGTVPAHCWVTDWFEHASPGIALLHVAPLSGVYLAVRLVLPVAPGWVLSGIVLLSLFTAVYGAGMATIQNETRRFFANLFLSLSSLVLVGLELDSEISLTGSLCLWFSAILSLGSFGIALRALEARFGRLSLAEFHGLYEHSPTLAVCFLLTGLATVGFPFTLGFISMELLVDGAVGASPYVGIAVVTAAAFDGIAVVRAYLLLFTGARHVSTISLVLGTRERIAILTLATLILGGGIFPQPGVMSRVRAAEEILGGRSGNRGARPELPLRRSQRVEVKSPRPLLMN